MNEPFDLPDEICEIIFNQLLPRDLLNCTLVSSVWKNYIVSFTKCWEKLILRIDQNLEFEEVTESGRRFTSLSFEKLQHEKMINGLRNFHETVKKIEIRDSSLAAKESVEKFCFKNLEELTLSNVSGRILYPFMDFQENLKVLNLHQLRGGIESLVNFTKLNRNLKELNLYLNDSSNMFHQDVSNIFQVSLESLTIRYRSNYEIDDRTLTNVEKFLKSQGNSLKTIGLINAVSFSSVYRIWNSMKAAEKLYFFNADHNFDTNNLILEDNFRLKSLEIHVLGPFELNISELQPLLRTAKNLKSLGVWKLNKELVEFAAENLPKLENIRCATMSNDCERFYDQLKTKGRVNATIKIHQYL